MLENHSSSSSSMTWSRVDGSHGESAVIWTWFSCSISSSVGGLTFMYGRPLMMLIGMWYPSTVMILCLPLMANGFSHTSFPKASSYVDEWILLPLPCTAYWLNRRITCPLLVLQTPATLAIGTSTIS